MTDDPSTQRKDFTIRCIHLFEGIVQPSMLFGAASSCCRAGLTIGQLGNQRGASRRVSIVQIGTMARRVLTSGVAHLRAQMMPVKLQQLISDHP
jgi:hypothetical protein